MLAWLIYVMMVTLLLSLAAYVAERTARLQRTPSRWIWALTIVASLLVPTVMSSVSIQVPNVFTPGVSQQLHALREVTNPHLSPVFWVTGDSGDLSQWRGCDALLKQAWLLVSIGMLLVLVTTGAMLFIRKRRWSQQVVQGTDLYLTQDVGPAVVGLLRPRIVVPAWVLQASHEKVAMVLAHEQSHLDARDPQLFTVALCLLVAMPWNLPLWWQLRRLRRAIEIDCDARVLGRGHAVGSYGETLIEVGERQSAFIGAVAAMSESTSFLEERIKIMVMKPAKWAKLIAAGLACLSLAVVAVAVQVGPPNGASAPAVGGETAGRKEVAVKDEVMTSYVGDYKLLGKVMHVSKKGHQLLAQLSGQDAFEIYPQSDTEFFFKVVDAQITFAPDRNGYTNSLVLHQNGAEIAATRIDAAAAQALEQSLQERVRFQQPSPGSEAALKRTLDALAAGNPNYGDMSPEMAKALKEHMSHLQPVLLNLGAVQSIQFKGVGSQGWDVYEAHYKSGARNWRIAIGDDGKITGLFMQQLP